jgi:hypothetical protein
METDDPLYRALYGNGRPGLLERMKEMETKIETLRKAYYEDVKSIHAKLENLEEYKTADEAKNELHGSRKWFIGMVVTSIASFITAIASITALIINNY